MQKKGHIRGGIKGKINRVQKRCLHLVIESAFLPSLGDSYVKRWKLTKHFHFTYAIWSGWEKKSCQSDTEKMGFHSPNVYLYSIWKCGPPERRYFPGKDWKPLLVSTLGSLGLGSSLTFSQDVAVCTVSIGEVGKWLSRIDFIIEKTIEVLPSYWVGKTFMREVMQVQRHAWFMGKNRLL